MAYATRTISKLLILLWLLPFARPGSAETLPAFTLEGVTNSDLDSKTLQGQPVVIQFWASWCTSCGGVSKELGQILANAKAKPKLLSVSLDETKEAAEKGLGRMRVPGAASQGYYFDRKRLLADRLGQVAVPTVLVIGPTGNVLSKISGHWGDAQKRELEARLSEL